MMSMKHLSITKTAKANAFAYTAPDSIYNKLRVLVVSGGANMDIYRIVLRGIWRLTPHTRVLAAKTPGLETWMLGANMGLVDLDLLPLRPYPNKASGGVISASSLIGDVDGCISVVSVKPDALDEPPSLTVLRELCVGEASLQDAYFTLGSYCVGAVVDLGNQIVWGDDPLAVDAEAYRLAGKPAPPILSEISKAR